MVDDEGSSPESAIPASGSDEQMVMLSVQMAVESRIRISTKFRGKPVSGLRRGASSHSRQPILATDIFSSLTPLEREGHLIVVFVSINERQTLRCSLS